jgi:hypothetical protein
MSLRRPGAHFGTGQQHGRRSAGCWRGHCELGSRRIEQRGVEQRGSEQRDVEGVV